MPVTQPGVADQFIKDVKESTAKILKNPKTETTGGVGVPNMLTRVKNRKINVGNLSKLRNSVFRKIEDWTAHPIKSPEMTNWMYQYGGHSSLVSNSYIH